MSALSKAVTKLDTLTLYRAVNEAGFNQLQKTGKFSAGPNSLGGKFFAENAVDAEKWGNLLNGSQYRIVEVELSRDIADKLQRWEKLDGIGPARYAELEQLGEIDIRGIE